MSFRLIYGRAGTGKTTYCFNEIKQRIDTAKKIYIITPEQFSFNAEKRLLETLGTNSVIKAEVLTFERMAYRIMNEVGGKSKTNLSVCGRSMLIYNILLKQKNNLKFLGKSDGNVDTISTVIAELKKHGVGVGVLDNPNINDLYLKTKLQDICLIYNKYEETIKNKYIDENDILTIIYTQLEQSEMFID